MNLVVTYDIVDNRRRARLHRFLKELGIPSQLSVFECRVDAREAGILRRYCLENLDLTEDSVRFYHVCSRCLGRAVILGQGVSLPCFDWMII